MRLDEPLVSAPFNLGYRLDLEESSGEMIELGFQSDGGLALRVDSIEEVFHQELEARDPELQFHGLRDLRRRLWHKWNCGATTWSQRAPMVMDKRAVVTINNG